MNKPRFEQVPLDEPRPLTDAERALLGAAIGLVGSKGLLDQAATAEVVSTCSCGCPSIGLRTRGSAPPAAELWRLTDVGRIDVVSLRTYGDAADGREIEVVVHLIEGLLHELEIWAGTYGGDVRTTLPDAATLRLAPRS